MTNGRTPLIGYRCVFLFFFDAVWGWGGGGREGSSSRLVAFGGADLDGLDGMTRGCHDSRVGGGGREENLGHNPCPPSSSPVRERPSCGLHLFPTRPTRRGAGAARPTLHTPLIKMPNGLPEDRSLPRKRSDGGLNTPARREAALPANAGKQHNLPIWQPGSRRRRNRFRRESAHKSLAW